MTLGPMATDVEQRIDFDALRAYKLQPARDQLEEEDPGPGRPSHRVWTGSPESTASPGREAIRTHMTTPIG